jgi:hypothetical protein
VETSRNGTTVVKIKFNQAIVKQMDQIYLFSESNKPTRQNRWREQYKNTGYSKCGYIIRGILRNMLVGISSNTKEDHEVHILNI